MFLSFWGKLMFEGVFAQAHQSPHSLASLVKGRGTAECGGGIPNLKFRFSHTHTNQNTKESLRLSGLCYRLLPAGIPPPRSRSAPPFDKGGFRLVQTHPFKL